MPEQQNKSTNPEQEGKSKEDMTGQDRLIGNVIFSWAGQFVFIVAGFVMPRLMDRQLGRELLGVWDFGWSLVSYFSLVQAGIGASVNRYVARYRAARDFDAMNRIVSSAFFVQVTAGMLALCLTIAVSLLLPQFFSVRLGENVLDAQWVVFFLGAYICSQISFAVFHGILTGCHRWALHNFIKSGWHMVTVFVMIAALLGGGGLRSLALISFIGQILASATRMVLAYRICEGLQIRLSLVGRDSIRKMFVFGGKTLIPSISDLLLNQTTCILIVAYLGPAALALYARPRSLILQLHTVISKMAMTLTPTASSLQSSKSINEIQQLMIKSVRYSFYIVLPIVMIMVIFGGEVLGFWMGPEYANGLLPAILAVGYLAMIVQLPVLNILAGLNAHGRAGMAQFFASLCSVGLTVLVLGFLKWRLAGVAIAVTLPLTIINIVYLPLLICRRVELDVKRYLLFVTVGPVIHVLPFAICLLAGRFVFKANPLNGLLWGGAVGGAILAVIYWRYVLPAKLSIKIKEFLVHCRAKVNFRYYLRQWVIRIFRWTGVIRICQYIHRNQVVILTLHGVMDEKDGSAWKPLRPRISRNKLEEYLHVLSKRYHFISLSDAVDMLEGRKPIKPYSVVFTFDDGYRNNYTHALPLLRRYNAPAIFFVSTGYVNKPQPLWFDRLDYALQHSSVSDCEVNIGSVTMRIKNNGDKTLASSYKYLRREAKKQHMSDLDFLREIDRLADKLEAESGRSLADIQAEDDWSAILSWKQIEKNGYGDLSYGSHTVDHIRLGLVEADTARDQLVKSKQDIEHHTGKPCQAICFPNGSYNEETIALAKENNYVCGVTTEAGRNCFGCDVMKLQRIDLPINVGSNELLYHICVANS